MPSNLRAAQAPASSKKRFRHWHNVDAMRFTKSTLRATLLHKYDPNQPRVAAGQPGGGQWTGDGSGSPSAADREVVHDTTGNELWRSVVNSHDADGALIQQLVSNRDGSRILSQFDGASWDERHTVFPADGGRLVFENLGSNQTIYDSRGQRLSETVMTVAGPEAQPVLQPASLSVIGRVAASAPRLLQGATIIYNWLTSQNSPDGIAVLAFRSDVYSPVVGLVGATIWTGNLTESELASACPAYPQVQALTDTAASGINRSDYPTSAVYGTAVHTRLRDHIRALNDPNLRAEVSLLKTLYETGERPERQETQYGNKGSLRVDVLENTNTGAVCVYVLWPFG